MMELYSCSRAGPVRSSLGMRVPQTLMPKSSVNHILLTITRAIEPDKPQKAASLVAAEATTRALLSGSPDQVSVVAMGDNGIKRTDEDELCAIHLRNRLEGRPGDADAIRRLILSGGEVGRFHDPARPYLHPEDVDIALDIDRYDFALRVNFEDGRPVARIETPAVTMPKSPT